MTSSRPSASDRHLTPTTAIIAGLRQHGYSCPLLPSSCQAVKPRFVHELVIAKLIVFADTGGVIGAEAWVSECEAHHV
jgi:hypothetical protein